MRVFDGRCAAVLVAFSLAIGAAEGATFTLSRQGLKSLDVRQSSVTVDVAETPEGLEYTITVPNNQPWSSQSFSWSFGGQGILTGVPIEPGSQLALRYTLLAAPPNAAVNVGPVLNTSDAGGVFQIGTATLTGVGNSVVSSVATNATQTTIVGSYIQVTGAEAPTWPMNGGVVRVLVSPVPNTQILGPTDPLRFVRINPCRVADTRTGIGPYGAPPLQAGTVRAFQVTGTCNIPPGAQAFSLNATVVPHGSLAFLTLYPAGTARPLASTLNSLDGRIKANAAIVPAGLNGSINVFVTNTTDFVLDVNGYFLSATDPAGLAFYPLPPCRVVDTREPNGLFGGPILQGAAPRSFPVPFSNCNIPVTAQAYAMNFTVVPNGPLGFLTAWPTGATRPVVSTLNALTGGITANAAIVPAGQNGEISVYATSQTHVIIDVNGYFAPAGAGGLSLYAKPPCRDLDTRQHPPAPWNGAGNIDISITPCAVPLDAQAYVFNATVVPQGSLGYLTLWEQGLPRPVASTLNALDGAITSNMAIVPTSNGLISAFTISPSHLILDQTGYFAP